VHLLVAAGTGFGAALLVPRDGALVALPSEGGHMDFAPRNPEEQALALFLRERHGRASIERVVSGPGIEDTYEFLAARGFADEPVARRAPGRDLAEVVSELALERRSPRAQAALRIFVSAYGAAAGNLVLAAFALGGVWIGGGIAPKIAPLLRDGVFRDALVAKGRMRPLLERVPIRLVKNPRTALFGAARLAAAAAP
jgi:glucokinase